MSCLLSHCKLQDSVMHQPALLRRATGAGAGARSCPAHGCPGAEAHVCALAGCGWGAAWQQLWGAGEHPVHSSTQPQAGLVVGFLAEPMRHSC